MNWHAVRVFLLCVIGFATILSFACTMAAITEGGTRREMIAFCGLTLTLIAADALLIGSVA